MDAKMPSQDSILKEKSTNAKQLKLSIFIHNISKYPRTKMSDCRESPPSRGGSRAYAIGSRESSRAMHSATKAHQSMVAFRAPRRARLHARRASARTRWSGRAIGSGPKHMICATHFARPCERRTRIESRAILAAGSGLTQRAAKSAVLGHCPAGGISPATNRSKPGRAGPGNTGGREGDAGRERAARTRGRTAFDQFVAVLTSL